MRTLYTFCDACNHIPFCGVGLHVEDGMPRGLSAWPGHPNRPCAKAYATLEEQGSPLRLTHPMVRGSPKGS
ncbi:MAG: hypothetical protein C0167_02270, partial [Nitrososphaera sp.]